MGTRTKIAKISSKVKFATKTGLAKRMLQSAFKAGIRPAWFVTDEVYSRDASFWRWLEQTLKQPYVLRFQVEGLPKIPNNPFFFDEQKSWKSGCVQSRAWTLIRLSLAELKRYLWKLLFLRSWSIEFILHWSFWRRKHQASARFFHYRKHGQIS